MLSRWCLSQLRSNRCSSLVSFRQNSMTMSLVTRMAPPDPMEVKLTETEDHICKLLDDCTKHLASEKGINTTCRVAGGWVRDKLLAIDSHDIDIALSDIMGVPFAEHLRDYALLNGIETGNITKIEQNPDQSKHLETATCKVFGIDIDLVNLRSEEYAESSRIPTGVSFGTPLQDALRRDITINALFYNVHSREVEDFTEKGLQDLRNGIIRTPLPPKETFLDDPLRVLRCVRFASRLGFEMVEPLKEAARDPIVKRALVEKVSRERVGDEITKMVQGRNPLHSAQLLQELDLYHPVFSAIPDISKSEIPPDFFESTPDEALAAVTILHTLTETHDHPVKLHDALLASVKNDRSVIARLYLATLLLPFRGFTYIDTKKKRQNTVTAVIRESLRLGTQNHYLDGISTLFDGIRTLKEGMRGQAEKPLQRAPLGLLLRNRSVHYPLTGNHWSTSLLFSLVTDLVPHYCLRENTFDKDQALKVVQEYNTFTERVIEFGLHNDVDKKPLVNGKDIVAAFQVNKVGPWVGKVLEDVVEWQLENPDKQKEVCLEWLRLRGANHYISTDTQEEPAPKRSRKK